MYEFTLSLSGVIVLKSVRPQDQKERTRGSGRLDKVVILWFDISIQYECG